MKFMTWMKLVILIGIGLASFSIMMVGRNASIQNNMTVSKERTSDNACWFLSSKGFDSVDRSVIEQRQNREIYGYPSDIAISKALEIFNEEQSCIYKNENSVPNLTEDEILSAIAVIPDYGYEGPWKPQSEASRFILTQKKLPKGSLLINNGGGTFPSPIGKSLGEEIRVKGQRIYLFLNLDKNPRMSDPLKQEQIILLKKTLSGLEGI